MTLAAELGAGSMLAIPEFMTMRVLVVTKIFPNRDKPDGATYNRHQLRELNRVADVEVMAVIPWLPGREQLGGPPVPDVPEHDVIDGLPVTSSASLRAGAKKSLWAIEWRWMPHTGV